MDIFKKTHKKLETRTFEEKSWRTKKGGEALFTTLLPLVILCSMTNGLRINKHCVILTAFYMFLARGCLGKTHLHLLLSKLLKNLSKHSLMQRLIDAKPSSRRGPEECS